MAKHAGALTVGFQQHNPLVLAWERVHHWQGKSKPAMVTHARGLLDELLLRFEGLFATPEGLPPSRPCDHRIHLLPGFTPVVVRPYRYPAI
jgi:hypothetical protein